MSQVETFVNVGNGSTADLWLRQASRASLFGMAELDLKSVFEMEPDAAHEARLDAEAEADVAASRVLPHERVREWLAKLARGQREPPPET